MSKNLSKPIFNSAHKKIKTLQLNINGESTIEFKKYSIDITKNQATEKTNTTQKNSNQKNRKISYHFYNKSSPKEILEKNNKKELKEIYNTFSENNSLSKGRNITTKNVNTSKTKINFNPLLTTNSLTNNKNKSRKEINITITPIINKINHDQLNTISSYGTLKSSKTKINLKRKSDGKILTSNKTLRKVELSISKSKNESEEKTINNEKKKILKKNMEEKFDKFKLLLHELIKD